MLEYYISYPFRWLAQWAGLEYNGEVRNGWSSHIAWGIALQMVFSTLFPYWIAWIPITYGQFRELQDCKYNLSNWNRKNTVDMWTWMIGCYIGLGILILKYII